MTAGEIASGLHGLGSRQPARLLRRARAAAASAPIDNWVDDGALSLGICSFAILDGAEAIVYDTHVSVAHARRIREALEQLGARRFRVVLSHWHLDHIAGTEAFADCEIIANRATAALLAEHRGAIEAGTHEGPPAISPLSCRRRSSTAASGSSRRTSQVELVEFDIHSRDATVLHLPHAGILLAGDTVEDTVTYVSEPDRLEPHIAELERMRGLDARRSSRTTAAARSSRAAATPRRSSTRRSATSGTCSAPRATPPSGAAICGRSSPGSSPPAG